MSSTIVNNKRVAKNTILLYFRMIFLMLIGLFTSRVILQALGVENYGINNVVAGFLSMFGIITSSMSSAISRFITVELGKKKYSRLKKVFSTAVTVQVLMGLLVVILIETFGIWFLNFKMNIPVGRETAANWCLHCAAITTFLHLMNVPFNSEIVAHEKMSAFAYMSIIEAVLKLAICYAIYISPIDKLISYSSLGVFVAIVLRTIYWTYCRKNFEECKGYSGLDKGLFREIWGFAGWNLFGQTAWILNTQGINMLMNVFFGVVVNAARGVAIQVNGVLNHFVTNFMMALNPQITKSYAAGDKEASFALACRGARFSFYIMFILALPILIESKKILYLWLGTPPEQADAFVIWTILSTFTTLLGNSLVTLQMAHGNIRHYQIWITIFGCIPFPLTWLIFKFGAPSIAAYWVYVAVYWGLIFVRFYLVHGMTGIPAKMYLGGVVAKTHIVAFLSAIIPVAIFVLMPESIARLLIVCSTSVLSSGIFIYTLGIDEAERHFIKDKVLSRITSKIH